MQHFTGTIPPQLTSIEEAETSRCSTPASSTGSEYSSSNDSQASLFRPWQTQERVAIPGAITSITPPPTRTDAKQVEPMVVALPSMTADSIHDGQAAITAERLSDDGLQPTNISKLTSTEDMHGKTAEVCGQQLPAKELPSGSSKQPAATESSEPTVEQTPREPEPQDESIMAQLLGNTDDGDDEQDDDLRVVRMREKGSSFLQEALDTLHSTVRDGNKTVREEIDKNTRAVRCLEKSVQENSEILRARNQVLTEIKDEIHQFILYYLVACGKKGEKRKKGRRRGRQPAPRREREKIAVQTEKKTNLNP